MKNPFQSFWMAGFECTDKLNAFGHRVDLLHATAHLDLLSEDYKRLHSFKMQTVREGIRWSRVEISPYKYDWSTVAKMMEVAREQKIQVVWDLCHFGYPDDLTPLHPMFARRFAAMCRSFVQFFRSLDSQSELIVTPINEVSFLAWLGGDVRGTSPYCVGQGWEVKYRLMKAYIEGIEAMKEVDPSVRILTTEPLVNIVPPLDATPEQVANAAKRHEEQFQVLDLLAGNVCPELRGKPEYLDILGYNFYHNNQFDAETNELLGWANVEGDPRWKPFHQILMSAYERYSRPVVLTETSHPLEHRPQWITYISEQAAILLEAEIPFWGICWYPIIDRPDWDHLHIWHRSGLWDEDVENFPARKLHEPTAKAILEGQLLLEAITLIAGIHPPVVKKNIPVAPNKVKV